MDFFSSAESASSESEQIVPRENRLGKIVGDDVSGKPFCGKQRIAGWVAPEGALIHPAVGRLSRQRNAQTYPASGSGSDVENSEYRKK
jgi:hypothetical protein